MSIRVLNVVSAQGSYRITTASGATYTLELLDGESDAVSAEGGSKNLVKSLYRIPGGLITVGRRMILAPPSSFVDVFGDKGVKTSPVTSIEPLTTS